MPCLRPSPLTPVNGYEHLTYAGMKIRPASSADAQVILEIYGPYVTDTAISFEEEPPSVEEMAERIETSHLWLVAEDDPGLVGYAYAGPFHPRPAYRWSVEVSIYLAPEAIGRGIGKELLRELLDGLRAKGFVNAFAGTTLPNPASVALFESFGFEKIAHQRKVGYKLGEWHDVGWWQLRFPEP
jgi:L-amino acid N-acyltransferase YncA